MRTSRSARRAGWNWRSDRGPRGGVRTNARLNASRIARTTANRETIRICLSSLLGSQLLQVGLLGSLDEARVPLRVDERIRSTGRTGALRLGLQIEHRAVLGDEDIGLQGSKDAKRLRVVIGNLRHPCVADEVHALVDRHAADEGDLILPSALARLGRPRRAALRVPG